MESKLIEQVRRTARTLHVAKRTEEAYVGWISRYLIYHRDQQGKWVHPLELGSTAVNEFLSHLAVERRVAASTQNQALSALLFLYVKILKSEIKIDAVREGKGNDENHRAKNGGQKMFRSIRLDVFCPTCFAKGFWLWQGDGTWNVPTTLTRSSGSRRDTAD
jgi:hypothetical protein